MVIKDLANSDERVELRKSHMRCVLQKTQDEFCRHNPGSGAKILPHESASWRSASRQSFYVKKKYGAEVTSLNPPPLSTDLGPILLHPFLFRPPLHSPPTISLPPLPPIIHFPKLPTRELSETARCIEAGYMADDFIDVLPEGCRRIVLLVFDKHHPPTERFDTQFPLSPERRSKMVRERRNIVPVRRHRRQPPALTIVPEE